MRIHIKDIATAIGVRLGTLISGGFFGVAVTEHEVSVIAAGIGVAVGLLFDAITGAIVRAREEKY